jgi:chemotaxis protein histidine kinase CheA
VALRLDKAVAPIQIEGEDVQIDPQRFRPLLRSLVHVFRNAVAHGVEKIDRRAAAGKDETATILCRIESLDGALALTIADDGAGLDIAALRRKCEESLTKEETARMSDAEIADLIFLDKMSTAAAATDISGRGVGLAAVRGAARDLGGEVRVEFEPGRGTSFVVTVPL